MLLIVTRLVVSKDVCIAIMEIGKVNELTSFLPFSVTSAIKSRDLLSLVTTEVTGTEVVDDVAHTAI